MRQAEPVRGRTGTHLFCIGHLSVKKAEPVDRCRGKQNLVHGHLCVRQAEHVVGGAWGGIVHERLSVKKAGSVFAGVCSKPQ